MGASPAKNPTAGFVAPLERTGERMVPESSDGSTFWEHVYRYAFACRFVAGKRVLDVACGEGYGAAALRAVGAANVIGVDISSEACDHARRKYGIDARLGSAEQIPLADASVDVVVSFETIEHVPDPAQFLAECRRVLATGGQLIISTPNKDVYSRPERGWSNPYHCSEMTEEEFISSLGLCFQGIRLYTQRPHRAAWWSSRALTAEAALGLRIYDRVRRSAQFRCFPRSVYEPSAKERESIVEEIVAASGHWTHPLNRYAVRPRLRWGDERATYFVARATRQG